MKQQILDVLRRDTVLTVSALLAIVSEFLVTPSFQFIEYIDFRVLGILLSLMIVMAGFQKNGLFDQIGRGLLKQTKSTRQLGLVLIGQCFFFSMLITNDVALITFVPFTMLILKACHQESLLIPVIVMQTLAANLGSMLTPIGNPQNLYLYNIGGFSVAEFISIMLPYSVLSLVGILIWTMVVCRQNEAIAMDEEIASVQMDAQAMRKNMVYSVLFLLSIFVVLKFLPYQAVLALVVGVTFVMDRTVLKRVDYSLIFTFCFFFIFTGNIGQMEAAHQWLQDIVGGREFLVGAMVSQVISNVPATLLLSGFTEHYRDILIGVNIGGLGTLIASMASLISYKIYTHEYNESKGKYFAYFTSANLVFLMVLGMAAWIV